MSNQILLTGKETNNLIDAFAEQWVNLIFEHIGYVQRSKNEVNKQYKTKQEYELHNNTK